MSSSRTRCLAGIALVLAMLLGSSHGQVGTIRPEPAKPIPGFDLASLPAGKTIGIPPSSAKVRQLLEQKGNFQMLCCQLGDLVKDLREKHKVATDLDLPALTADRKGTDTILNAVYENVSIRSMLKRVLSDHGLTYVIRDELLIITTKTAAETLTSPRIYQVHDLVLKPNDPAGRPDLESLASLIMSMVRPEAWMGDEIKAIEAPGVIALVANQTDDVHEEIERFLTDLRAAKTPAVYELQMQRERIVPIMAAPPGVSTPPAATGASN